MPFLSKNLITLLINSRLRTKQIIQPHIIYKRADHKAAQARHWCGTRKMPVNSNTYAAYMHKRLRVKEILKDFLKTRLMPAIKVLYLNRNMQSNTKYFTLFYFVLFY